MKLAGLSLLLCFSCFLSQKTTVYDCNTRVSTNMGWIIVSKDGTHFVQAGTNNKFKVWGVNYDHDDKGRLIEDYWEKEWDTVVDDFKEMKQLGANVIRIHLQLPRFMITSNKPNPSSAKQLTRLLRLAESTGLYLDITGLACYRKADVPKWYDRMTETERWNVQANFWEVIAGICRKSPAVFCYDLMNEPLIPDRDSKPKEWLAGELAGFYYDQQLTLDLKGREQKKVAKAWIDKLVTAIRKKDNQHMLTVGVIPLAFYFPGAKPLFYDKDVSQGLDFVSVHLYPKTAQIDEAITGLKMYNIGKPLLVEEMFPMECTIEELNCFVQKSAFFADGYMGFYWGKTAEEYAGETKPNYYMIEWLKYFKSKSSAFK